MSANTTSVVCFLQEKDEPIVAEKLITNYDFDNELLEHVLYLIGHYLIESDLIVNAQEKHITEYAF